MRQREPRDWEGQGEHPNRPVVGISWFEAVAYCNWLTHQFGERFRLPTDRGWKEAATSADGGDYPWGKEEPTPEFTNYDDNVGNPTPVGVYPAGAAPGGHLDMAGNVWEWCADSIGEKGDDRVIRGGGCYNFARYCRSAYRFRYHPGNRYRILGFRLSRSLGP